MSLPSPSGRRAPRPSCEHKLQSNARTRDIVATSPASLAALGPAADASDVIVGLRPVRLLPAWADRSSARSLLTRWPSVTTRGRALICHSGLAAVGGVSLVRLSTCPTCGPPVDGCYGTRGAAQVGVRQPSEVGAGDAGQGAGGEARARHAGIRVR